MEAPPKKPHDRALSARGGGAGDPAPPANGPFRIAAVAELTGVPEPTLRAWERRYGIPTPDRTASGYRLYGRREVEDVREMKRLAEAEGLAAAEAAKVVLGRRSGASADVAPVLDEPYAAATEAILAAVERFDDDGLDRELRRLQFMGSPTTLLDRVLEPALVEIGERWHDGTLSIAQEHFASERIGTLLRDLARLSIVSAEAGRVVCACFAEEDHEIGLIGTAIRLASLGMRPVILGARTPPSAVRSAVTYLSPVLVALSVTQTPPRARARELVDEYASACGATPLLVGGMGVASIRDLVTAAGAVVAPVDPSELRECVRRTIDRRERKGVST